MIKTLIPFTKDYNIHSRFMHLAEPAIITTTDVKVGGS
jgi:hypothetical protein